MCNKRAPVLFLSNLDGVNIFNDGRPQCVLDALAGSVVDSNLGGGGFASLDVGATPVALPTSGWVITPGTDSGYRGGIVRALFSGPGLGSGASGILRINSSTGVVQSISITGAGSGHTGIITATPRIFGNRRVTFDLGENWHQYTRVLIGFNGFTATDSILRAQVWTSRDNRNRMDVMALHGASEAWIQPVSGGTPVRSVLIGGRFVHVVVDCGVDTGPDTAVRLIAHPA